MLYFRYSTFRAGVGDIASKIKLSAKEKKLHKVFSGFGSSVVTLLKREGFFNKENPTVPAKFWPTLKKVAIKKNGKAFEIAFEEYSLPALEHGASKVSRMLGVVKPTNVNSGVAWVDAYYEERKTEFVRLTTNADLMRVRALTTSESLDLYKLIDENRYVNERAFSKKLKDSYICDGDQARLKRCKRTESHRASTGGAFGYAKEVGAEEKSRLTAGDDRVREEHQQDADEGWIPIDEPYPYSGEIFAGENSINCRCRDLFKFTKSKPEFEEEEETTSEEENESEGEEE